MAAREFDGVGCAPSLRKYFDFERFIQDSAKTLPKNRMVIDDASGRSHKMSHFKLPLCDDLAAASPQRDPARSPDYS
ncbi:hypothetical protein [Thioclava marina]|uniref:hypothetical protein n=1 Tax=Thioclava marina TaxID=1915077 RepID=UPI0023563F4F|nr:MULTISPECIES: hypothetical protein [Thioclava]